MDYRVLLPEGAQVNRECIEAVGGDELIAGILYRRGIDSPEDMKAFLYEESYRPFNPLDLEGIEQAIELILCRADHGAKLCIYGDYDVDGITSSVLLKEALDPIVRDVIYHIPHRFTEGYGMNKQVVRELGAQGVDLIITCDCGISNYDEVELARDLGMDIIVTDHHTPPSILPPANVILNPKLYGEPHPLHPLPGVGVAYMLAIGLYETIERRVSEGKWLDLVALGIIADVVPVLGECRYLLRKGLPYLLRPERVGLKALYSVLSAGGTQILDEEDIAFQISPRINAAGRMDSPYLPAKLLLENDLSRATEMAVNLDALNRHRKLLQNQIFERAVQMVEKDQSKEGILVLYNPNWHEGVLGIVAGKIAETYKRPSICLTLKEDGSTVTGSARSVGDVSIYELLLECRDYLMKFGGHKQAAGMSMDLENLEGFTHHIQGLLPIEQGVQESLVDIDVEADILKVDDLLLKRIERMAPFGHGFPKPVFSSKDVDIISSRPIGSNHQRFIFQGGNSQLSGIWWWASREIDENFEKGDIVYTLGYHRSGLSLTILEMAECKGIEPTMPAPKYEIIWHDRRGQPVEDILREYKDGIIYYEGLEDIGYSTVTRYDVTGTDRLIMLSTPPAPNLFRELILSSRAREVILGFGDESSQSINDFLKQLQGLLKHAIVHKNGVVSIEELSMILCVTEEFIELCLIYLEGRGFIDYIWDERDRVVLYRGTKKRQNRRVQLLLNRTFSEMMSFKRYMYRQKIWKIDNLVNKT